MPVYKNGELVFPRVSTTPLPTADLPQDCVDDFTEARDEFATSPRSSAALLRLCITKLCIHLGELGKNINTDIGNLVKNGLDVRIQRALDIVRVTGNNAVDPGTMDLNDTPELARKLFDFVNLVVNEMITKSKEIDVFYKTLPQGALDVGWNTEKRRNSNTLSVTAWQDGR